MAISTKASEREKRRAMALRENLKRRRTATQNREALKPPASHDAMRRSSQLGPNKAQKSE